MWQYGCQSSCVAGVGFRTSSKKFKPWLFLRRVCLSWKPQYEQFLALTLLRTSAKTEETRGQEVVRDQSRIFCPSLIAPPKCKPSILGPFVSERGRSKEDAISECKGAQNGVKERPESKLQTTSFEMKTKFGNSQCLSRCEEEKSSRPGNFQTGLKGGNGKGGYSHLLTSFQHATSENGSCAAVFGLLRCRSCTATVAFLQCGSLFFLPGAALQQAKNCSATLKKLRCKKVALSCRFPAAFKPPHLGPHF